MPYIRRDAQGRIIAVFDSPQTDANEIISPTAPELMNFLGQVNDPNTAKTVLSS